MIPQPASRMAAGCGQRKGRPRPSGPAGGPCFNRMPAFHSPNSKRARWQVPATRKDERDERDIVPPERAPTTGMRRILTGGEDFVHGQFVDVQGQVDILGQIVGRPPLRELAGHARITSAREILKDFQKIPRIPFSTKSLAASPIVGLAPVSVRGSSRPPNPPPVSSHGVIGSRQLGGGPSAGACCRFRRTCRARRGLRRGGGGCVCRSSRAWRGRSSPGAWGGSRGARSGQ